jgi:hypothetical protein
MDVCDVSWVYGAWYPYKALGGRGMIASVGMYAWFNLLVPCLLVAVTLVVLWLLHVLAGYLLGGN